MATDFSKLVQIFDSFDKYTTDVVKRCLEFSETAQAAGLVIGAGTGVVTDALLADENGKSSGLFTELFAWAGQKIGEKISNSNTRKQLEKCKNEIYEYTISDRDAYFNMLKETIDQTKEQLLTFEQSFAFLKSQLINKIKFDESDESLINLFKDCVAQFFQCLYVNRKAIKLCVFYVDFEEKLDEDVIEFGNWAKEVTYVDKKETYKECCLKVADDLFENTSDEEYIKIDYTFACLKSKVYFDGITPLLSPCFDIFISLINKKQPNLNEPKFYYKGNGFEKMFNAISKNFYYKSRPRKLDKLRNILVGIIPSVITSLYILGFNKIIHIPLGMFTVFSSTTLFGMIALLTIKFFQKKGFFFGKFCSEGVPDWGRIASKCAENEFKRSVEVVFSYEDATSAPTIENIDSSDSLLEEILTLQQDIEQTENV